MTSPQLLNLAFNGKWIWELTLESNKQSDNKGIRLESKTGIWETLAIYQRAPDTSAVLSPLGKYGDVLSTVCLKTKQFLCLCLSFSPLPSLSPSPSSSFPPSL